MHKLAYFRNVYISNSYSGNLGRPPRMGFFFVDFIYLEKYSKPVFPWLFLIFRDKWNGASVILQKCPWKLIIPTRVTWCVRNFVHFTNITFQWDFNCKMCLAKYDHRNLVCEESSYTMTPYDEKTVLKCAWRFVRIIKNSPMKYPHFGGKVYKICMLCMFCCIDTILLWTWLKMGVGKSKIVWFWNKGCRMSQENVSKFWVALHPRFTISYSVLMFPEHYEDLTFYTIVRLWTYKKYRSLLLILCYVKHLVGSKPFFQLHPRHQLHIEDDYKLNCSKLISMHLR